MKLYRFWIQEPGMLLIDGVENPVCPWGGSNISVDDARRRAREKMAAAQARIDQHKQIDKTSYEVEIREEIIEVVDDNNVVSRNRYGALVLNSANTLFIDIDHPVYEWRAAFRRLFLNVQELPKEAIIRQVKERAQHPRYKGLGFRIYETFSGVRVLVTGRLFDPRSRETSVLFEDFNADRLYAALCRRQNCFRARLTPKPHRADCPRYKVTYPRDPAEQSSLELWLRRYEQASQPLAVCRLVSTVGISGDTPIVSFHDEATKALTDLSLA